MKDLEIIHALNAAFERLDPLSRTRFSASEPELPFTPPPYSSLIDDALRDNRIHLYRDKLRQIALHPVKLKAGQTEPMTGEMGKNFNPATLPEMRGGSILDSRG